MEPSVNPWEPSQMMKKHNNQKIKNKTLKLLKVRCVIFDCKVTSVHHLVHCLSNCLSDLRSLMCLFGKKCTETWTSSLFTSLRRSNAHWNPFHLLHSDISPAIAPEICYDFLQNVFRQHCWKIHIDVDWRDNLSGTATKPLKQRKAFFPFYIFLR